MAALAVAPLVWIALTAYGTEGVIRVYYFSLPFLAFFAASAVYPKFSSGKVRSFHYGGRRPVRVFLWQPCHYLLRSGGDELHASRRAVRHELIFSPLPRSAPSWLQVSGACRLRTAITNAFTYGSCPTWLSMRR